MEVTQQLYGVCADPQVLGKQLRRTSTLPEYQGVDILLVPAPAGHSTEIILFKPAVLKIFNECHTRFNTRIRDSLDYSDDAQLREMYFVCFGMMVATPGNTTAVKYFYKVVEHIYTGQDRLVMTDAFFLKQRLLTNSIRAIETLLTSNMDKLNASSILWLLYKKMLQLRGHHEGSLDTCLQAARVHQGNYYAWQFINHSILNEMGGETDSCISKIRKYCHENTRDSSAWSCYMKLAGSSCRSANDVYELFHQIETGPSSDFVQFAASRNLLLQYLQQHPNSAKEIVSFLNQIANRIPASPAFSELKNKIISHKSWFEINSFDKNSDIFLADRLTNYFHWTELAKWVDKFGTTPVPV